MPDASVKPVIFISYSHKDRRWLEFVQGHLQVAVTNNHFESWDDRRIEGGAAAARAARRRGECKARQGGAGEPRHGARTDRTMRLPPARPGACRTRSRA